MLDISMMPAQVNNAGKQRTHAPHASPRTHMHALTLRRLNAPGIRAGAAIGLREKGNGREEHNSSLAGAWRHPVRSPAHTSANIMYGVTGTVWAPGDGTEVGLEGCNAFAGRSSRTETPRPCCMADDQHLWSAT